MGLRRRRERRRFARTGASSLYADLGVVLDLSPGGMRLIAAAVPEGEVDVTLLTMDGSLPLRARLAWSRRQGLKRWELGFAFVGVDPETHRRLERVAAVHQRLRTAA